jgi:hypothetical protein
MQLFIRWIMPITFVGIGIAILAGWTLEQLPKGTLLRPLLGMVVVLLGVHRFAASRIERRSVQRRYGGGRNRPWENRNDKTGSST